MVDGLNFRHRRNCGRASLQYRLDNQKKTMGKRYVCKIDPDLLPDVRAAIVCNAGYAGTACEFMLLRPDRLFPR
jgi:hypothetical protein